MNISVVMPQLGLTMTEGTVSEWLKKPGDQVQKGEPLFVVSTDKADMEVESLTDGTLARILVETGKTVPVKTVIAYIEITGDEAAAEAPAATHPESGSPQPPAAEVFAAERSGLAQPARGRQAGRRAASPRARRLARELGADLSTIEGSGPGGRIVEEDVRKIATSAPSRAAVPDIRHRQLIAERMTQSIQTIPDFSLAVEVNAEQLLAAQETLKKFVEKATGLKLTLTDLFVKAVGLALAGTPLMNAVWEEEVIRRRNTADVGLAIATERGVVAPVIRNADTLDPAGIALRRNELAERARQGRLSLPDLEGGSGTLSNLGMYRVDHFQAIISPGQSFVLAVGRVRMRPWAEGATVTVKPTVVLNLSVDHRVADGATAARFLERIAEIIEDPMKALHQPGGCGSE
jgi:pyruvate dehydrogenase E2 component (dihydrolipoyllysine-residue acetyltransferase)